jgi:hypothetical protein
MSMTRLSGAAAAVAVAIVLGSAVGQGQGSTIKLADAKSVKCAFPLISTGTWEKDGTVKSATEKSDMTLQYDDIDIQEGTASVIGLSGKLYIITRMAGVNLHLLAIDGAGPLYITTVFDKPAHPGKFKAAHSRHEFTDVQLPGFTSRPEQYYGECEILK